jgi:hypothetical protein
VTGKSTDISVTLWITLPYVTSADTPRPNAPRLLNLKDSAAYLGIPIWSVRELVWGGALPQVRLPGVDGVRQRRVWIDVRDLEAVVGRFKEREQA